ncbi:hypothetical protein CBQ28_08625 [Pseudoalteromonas sp. GCY]|uniref:DUF3019 domain-containing protein n=1 Tax=Pseudoalteromonas sp. GCY TaxID=2003316 RepID=UPI000BFEB8C7|nr:DUF3019 domain-containing protein [Pseudoalteromonas sp. GCY]PHI37423.1 hypothetical protein CBQ28_08625 [Pseudoalteromonas sp. GCY]QQQ64864.1 DUF3019 domain-containing protein [Pseudoalteromonas sp. GCY]
MKKRLFGLALLAMQTQAKEEINVPVWTVKPGQCVALEQGQQCFIDLSVTWQTSVTGNFCLHADEKELVCWQQQKTASWQGEILVEKDLLITLEDNKDILASYALQYAWVFKQQKSNAVRWRLF